MHADRRRFEGPTITLGSKKWEVSSKGQAVMERTYLQFAANANRYIRFVDLHSQFANTPTKLLSGRLVEDEIEIRRKFLLLVVAAPSCPISPFSRSCRR